MLMESLQKLMDEFVNVFIYTLDMAWIDMQFIDCWTFVMLKGRFTFFTTVRCPYEHWTH